ncbi:hypothetical protein [Chitiniphilus shinanonensis]|uniref:hypothetical protein n=1 Tax=Chitiniphilus shinanonensis TaxID=553088 RepID=UPI003055AE9C
MTTSTTWYRQGSIATTNASTAVLGSGTRWNEQVLPGDILLLDGALLEIAAVDDDTRLTLRQPYAGATASGLTYGIIRNFTGTLPADLAARWAKLTASYQLSIDELAELLTSTGTVTLTRVSGEQVQVPGLAGLDASWTQALAQLEQWLAQFGDVSAAVSAARSDANAAAASQTAAAISASAAGGSATAAANSEANAASSLTAANGARDTALAARDASTAARDATWAARDQAVAAAQVAQTVIDPGTVDQYWRGDKTWQPLAAAVTAVVGRPGGVNQFANGDMRIAQLGTTYNLAAGASGYTLDRWFVSNQTNAAITVSQVSGGPDGTQSAMRITAATAPTSGDVLVVQRLDGVRILPPGLVSLSAQVYCATATPTTAEVVQNFGSGGSASVQTNLVGITQSNATGVRMTASGTLPGTGGKIIGANSFLAGRLTVSLRHTQPVDLVDLQLEEGPPTPFERLDRTLQLLRCQRFRYVMDLDRPYERIGYGASGGGPGSPFWSTLHLPTPMRSVPAVTLPGPAAFTWGSPAGTEVATLVNNVTTQRSLTVTGTVPASITLTYGSGGYLMVAPTPVAGARILLDAEIY